MKPRNCDFTQYLRHRYDMSVVKLTGLWLDAHLNTNSQLATPYIAMRKPWQDVLRCLSIHSFHSPACRLARADLQKDKLQSLQLTIYLLRNNVNKGMLARGICRSHLHAHSLDECKWLLLGSALELALRAPSSRHPSRYRCGPSLVAPWVWSNLPMSC